MQWELPLSLFYSVTIMCSFFRPFRSYAPWCNTCKTIRKEYERAARLAWDLKLPVSLARLNVDKAESVEFAKDTMGIVNLPTFVLFKGSVEEVNEFPVLTTAEAFVAGLGKMIGSELDLTPAKVFSDEGPIDVASWIFWRGTSDGKLQTTLMYYSPPQEDLTPEAAKHSEEAFKAFDAAAKELMRFSNLRFAICRRKDVMEAFDIPLDRASLVLYKEHDEGRVEFTGALTDDGEELKKWVLVEDTPLVTDVWHKNLQAFRKRVPNLILFFISGEQFEHYPTITRVKEGLQEVAFTLLGKGLIKKGEFTIAVADGTKYKSWVSNFGLPTGRFPAVGAEYTPKQRMRAFDDFAVEASLLDHPLDRLEAALAQLGDKAADMLATSQQKDEPVEATVPLESESEQTSEQQKEADAAYQLKELQFETKLYGLSPEAQKAREATKKEAAGGAEAVAVGVDGSVTETSATPDAAASPTEAASASPMPAKFEHAQSQQGDKIPWVKVPVQTLVEKFEGYFHFLKQEQENSLPL
jgi:thiol-disulfide isomerase/thioredoxin